MFILKVDPKFIIIFPQRLPRIHIFHKNYAKWLEIFFSRNNINNMKLLAQTNRQQTPTAAWARGLNLFFFAILMSHYSWWIKKASIVNTLFYFQYQDAPIAAHQSADPVLALTDGPQSFAGRAFLFPSQYTHQCFNNRPRLDYRF